MLIDVSVLTDSFRLLLIQLSLSSSFLHEFEFQVWTSVDLVTGQIFVNLQISGGKHSRPMPVSKFTLISIMDQC